MSTYVVYAPVELKATNFAGFKEILTSQANGNLSARLLSDFITTNQNDLMPPVKAEKNLIQRHATIAGAFTRTMMWKPQGADINDMSRAVMLFLDVLPDGTGPDGKPKHRYEPRQYIMGANAQCVIPYRLDCCPGLSALAFYKSGGQLNVALLEDDKYTTADHRDLFGVNRDSGESVKIDHDGHMLKHWQDHMLGTEHNCGGSAKIAFPEKRLGAFAPILRR